MVRSKQFTSVGYSHKKARLLPETGLYAFNNSVSLARRQGLGATHDFENPGREGRLPRPVVSQLAGLEQRKLPRLFHY